MFLLFDCKAPVVGRPQNEAVWIESWGIPRIYLHRWRGMHDLPPVDIKKESGIGYDVAAPHLSGTWGVKFANGTLTDRIEASQSRPWTRLLLFPDLCLLRGNSRGMDLRPEGGCYCFSISDQLDYWNIKKTTLLAYTIQSVTRMHPCGRGKKSAVTRMITLTTSCPRREN